MLTLIPVRMDASTLHVSSLYDKLITSVIVKSEIENVLLMIGIFSYGLLHYYIAPVGVKVGLSKWHHVTALQLTHCFSNKRTTYFPADLDDRSPPKEMPPLHFPRPPSQRP